MKKITHITVAHKSNSTRIFAKEAMSAKLAGIDVSIVAPHPHDEVVKGISVRALPSFKSRFVRWFKGGFLAYKFAMKEKADFYQIHDSELLFLGICLKFAGKKVIYDAHEDLPVEVSERFRRHRVFKKIVRTSVRVVESFLSKRMFGIVAATPHIQQRFRSIGCPRVVNINNYPILSGFDLEGSLDRKANFEAREFCYVGTIAENRGIFEIMDACYACGASLNLCGVFSSALLEKQCRERPSWSAVRYYGYLGQEKLVEVMSKSVAGFVVLHPLENFKDSIPVKMFEYMAVGLPFIASDFVFWRELLTDCKSVVFVDPLDPEEIKQAIFHLLKNYSDFEFEAGKAALLVRESFSWGTEAKKLIEFYRKYSSCV